jgi:nitroreductase
METKTKQKSAAVNHPVSELILNRKSTRVYTDEIVSEEKIHSLFEATRWAPSSTNEQPWLYLYAKKTQTALWSKLFEPLSEGNKIWVKDAPLLILSLARKDFQRNGRPNAYALYDLGGANSLLALQAVALGLQARQMAGFDPDMARKTLNIPDEFELGVFIAVGYPGDLENIQEAIKQKELAPRERYLQQEFIRNSIF